MFLYVDNVLKITQFKKILLLSSQEIKIALQNYDLLINGNNLNISYFYSEEMFINGHIKGITLLWK